LFITVDHVILDLPTRSCDKLYWPSAMLPRLRWWNKPV